MRDPMRKGANYIRNYYFLLLAVLTLILISSLIWNIHDEYVSTVDYATIEGDASYHKDLLFRRWASMHGGVYVPVTPESPPNPYLTFVKERDIVTESGKKLTLMNPAYLIRQVFEIAEEQTGVRGHITSLNPIRPENKADEWEAKALGKFHHGAKEFGEVVEIKGSEYLRYMSPMKVEPQCMKCHAHQGYSVGEIRGGISVSVPMDKYQKIYKTKVTTMVTTHITVYLVLLSFSLLGYKRVKKEMKTNYVMQQKIAINEEFLKVKNTELEQVNTNLRYAKEKAEESDILKTAFLQNMSHEIRTPLNAICGFSGMLSEPDLGEDMSQSYVSIIQNSSDQLLSIVSDILTISSLETKQVQISSEKIKLNETLYELKAVFDQEASIKGIRLILNIQQQDSLLEIKSDKTKLIQVLTNLLINAFKFTQKGSIEFGFIKKDEEVEFFIKDTGIGIKPEMQAKVFERFRQADILHPIGGNGLGLSISRGFVELLGGNIWLESEYKKGSTFYFTIPYAPESTI